MEVTPRPPVVVVTGPTGAGKTRQAIALARRFGGEIINADSMQVYRHLDIGTSKPTLEERAAAPHHLLDVVTPDVEYSAARYVAEARSAAQQIHARGRLVLLTGGTGLYIRAFLSGIVAGAPADSALRQELEQRAQQAADTGDAEFLKRELEVRDPVAAARIHANDWRRLIRALEMLEQTGRTASDLREEHRFGELPYRVLHLALDPGTERLNEWTDRRCEAMIEAGLLREVRGLRKRGYGAELRPFKAIGYRHMAAVVDGSETLAGALELMQRDTRRFARRQRTWLRAVPDAIWIDPEDDTAIAKHVETFLKEGAAG